MSKIEEAQVQIEIEECPECEESKDINFLYYIMAFIAGIVVGLFF